MNIEPIKLDKKVFITFLSKYQKPINYLRRFLVLGVVGRGL